MKGFSLKFFSASNKLETDSIYQKQLLFGFYKKRGKALAIPHIIYCLNRLLERENRKKIKILDIGCNNGQLLQLLQDVANTNNFIGRIELYGIDVNEQAIKEAKEKTHGKAKFYIRDLALEHVDPVRTKFDLIVCLNTFHEVYGQVLKKTSSVEAAKNSIFRAFTWISQHLNEEGSLVFYDGVSVSEEKKKRIIDFKILDEAKKEHLLLNAKKYSLLGVKYSYDEQNTFTMNYENFARYIALAKYVNSPLWSIESEELYQFFTERDYGRALKGAGLYAESKTLINNDLGLWKHIVQIITPDILFPNKAILYVASKHYISTFLDTCTV